MEVKVDLDLNYTECQEELFLKKHYQKYIIVTKGRRFGATQGAAQAFIEELIQGNGPLLWVDTIYANIDRYYDRYFLPVLRQLPRKKWSWHGQRKELKIVGNALDFRSADKPENIEGFGYKKIFLNEAGIILKNDSLYTKTLLPMLMDYSDSQLIAAGVPKGMYKKDGFKHKFYELYENCLEDPDENKYKLMQYTSYDNPFLTTKDIDEISMELSPDEIKQEIGGEFVESGGKRPFCAQYDKMYHEAPVERRKDKQLVFTMDINFDPMAICISNFWKEGNKMFDHQFDELSIENANVFRAADIIKQRYGNQLYNAIFIGDSMGNKREMSHATMHRSTHS